MLKRLMRPIYNFAQYILKGGHTTVRTVTPIAFDNRPLQDKTILITGATSGIGLKSACTLAEMGANIIISGRNEGKLNDALSAVPGSKGIIWDIRDTSLSAQKINEALSLFGDIDILINNAGIYNGADMLHIDEKIFDDVITTNFKGTYFTTKSFIENIDISSNKTRKIVNILSIRSFTSSTNAYCASKWAEKCMNDGLAKEILHKNIIVNAVAPGPTTSNINHISPEGNTYLQGNNRVNHFLIPEEIVNVIAFLCTDMSNGIVGQTIVVDGGEIIQ